MGASKTGICIIRNGKIVGLTLFLFFFHDGDLTTTPDGFVSFKQPKTDKIYRGSWAL
jgi:hypothetical protein